MLTRILTLSAHSLKQLLHERSELAREHCFISIVGTGFAPIFPSDTGSILCLVFDDAKPENNKNGNKYRLFNKVQARRIIAFLKENHARPEPMTLYIQCGAGISRSGAVASFANEFLGLDQSSFQSDNPSIEPNQHVYSVLRAESEA